MSLILKYWWTKPPLITKIAKTASSLIINKGKTSHNESNDNFRGWNIFYLLSKNLNCTFDSFVEILSFFIYLFNLLRQAKA